MKHTLSNSIVLTLLLILNSNFISAQETTWAIDKNHSNVTFEVSYFGIGTVKGSFDDFEGKLIKSDEGFEKANVSFKIQASSINTNQDQRDEHLKGEDFFHVEKNPIIEFESKSFRKIDEDNYQMKGKLLMGGISKDITLNVINKGSFVHPRFKKTVSVLEISGIVLREAHEIGTKYGPASKALGNEIKLSAQIQLTEEVKTDN